MSFFLSSPPQPTYQRSYQLPHEQQSHSFLTPQTHRTTYFPTSNSIIPYQQSRTQVQTQFQPKSPSPLQPSWNAGNVMRRSGNNTGTSKVWGVNDQTSNANTWGSDSEVQQENTVDGHKSFQAIPQPGASQYTTPSDPPQQSQSFSTNLVSAPPTNRITTTHPDPTQSTSTSSQQRNPFSYQSAATSLAPTSLLSTRLATTRSTRRTLFLDRLRSSRRDERDNHIIERFEKEEYWRERRRREERLEREAGRVLVVDENWEDEFDDDEDGQMTPIDEYEDQEGLREVEGLVEGWLGGGVTFPGGDQNGQGGQTGIHEIETEIDDMDAQFDFEDSDVEEVFMQVLSQQEQLSTPSQVQPQVQLQQTQEQHGLIRGNGHEAEDLEMLVALQGQSQRDTDML